MRDAEARRRIREDHAATLWVEAAAGTGKTTELVGRIVGLVASGRGRLATTAAVTFTDKAAGELRLRLRTEIDRARAAEGHPARRQRLDAATRELDTARVGTIHALCADLLRERPVEAGVDPLFVVLGDDERGPLVDHTLRQWLDALLPDPPEGIRRLLRRPPAADGTGPYEALRDACLRVIEHRDFDGAWTRPPVDREGLAQDAVAALRDLARFDALAPSQGDPLGRLVGAVADWTKEHDLRGEWDLDALEHELPALVDKRWRDNGRGQRFGAIGRQEVLAARDHARARIEELRDACGKDLAPLLHAELQGFVAAWEEAKQKAGRLDYVDLLLLVERMLVRDGTLRRDLQRRFQHVLVDEFQDTDPLQARILLLLTADDADCADPDRARPVPGKLFVVGDPKQAIYRFRRADLGTYATLRARLSSQGAEVLTLSTSFRADPRLQEAINAAFAPRMRGGGQAEYVPLHPWRSAHARPALMALPVPVAGEPTKTLVEATLPDCVGNFVAWALSRDGWGLPAHHVAVLFRATKRYQVDLVGPLARALDARGIPHAVVGGRAFHDRDEVRSIRSALKALEWPEDTLSVYATLKGPLFGLPDASLFLWKHTHGTLHPLHVPEDPGSEALLPVRDALAVLASLRRARNRRSVGATLHELLVATRAHAGFASAVNGEQVLANVLRVGQLARRAERFGVSSFRGFVETLDEEAERGEAADAPIVEEGTEGVRILTVHKAKGLEFPVVILADPTTTHSRRHPSRYVDPERRVWATELCGYVPADLADHAEEVLAEDRDEADRILYVAATRARDTLVVPVVEGAQPDGWMAPLDPVLRAPQTAVAHTGARHVPWEGGVRAEVFASAESGGADGHRAWLDWTAKRERALAQGATCTIDAALATEVRGAGGGVALEQTARAAGRPGGARFGTLVHAALAGVPLDGGAEEVEHEVALHARILGATAEEEAAARGAVAAALAHPLMRRAAASADCRREVACAVVVDGRLVEGIADLVFREAGGWVVVDHKTDEDLAGRVAVYGPQVRAYAAAVSAATGQAAEGLLFGV